MNGLVQEGGRGHNDYSDRLYTCVYTHIDVSWYVTGVYVHMEYSTINTVEVP